MELYKSAQKLQRKLAKAGIPSAIIGGIAISAWGEPRFTGDVDLKVLVERDEAKKLLGVLEPEYKLTHKNPEDAIRRLGYIFVQDSDNVRLDLLLSDTEFDRQVIAHAQDIQIVPRIKLRMCTAEDLIIYKMISTRSRDIADVQSVIKRQKSNLDVKYIIGWLRQFEQALDDSTLVSTYQQQRKSK